MCVYACVVHACIGKFVCCMLNVFQKYITSDITSSFVHVCNCACMYVEYRCVKFGKYSLREALSHVAVERESDRERIIYGRYCQTEGKFGSKALGA